MRCIREQINDKHTHWPTSVVEGEIVQCKYFPFLLMQAHFLHVFPSASRGYENTETWSATDHWYWSMISIPWNFDIDRRFFLVSLLCHNWAGRTRAGRILGSTTIITGTRIKWSTVSAITTTIIRSSHHVSLFCWHACYDDHSYSWEQPGHHIICALLEEVKPGFWFTRQPLLSIHQYILLRSSFPALNYLDCNDLAWLCVVSNEIPES